MSLPPHLRCAFAARCRRLALAALLVLAHGAGAAAATGADAAARLGEARSDPKLAEALLKAGRKAAAVCAHCHGEGGSSVKPDVPNLAGQNPAYLLEQMRAFAEGRRRFEFMEGMIRAMSTDERAGAALFYAQQTLPVRAAADATLATRGRAYYAQVCARCHAADGRGSEQFARLAGQQPEYLRQTLRRYRDGTGSRINALMAANTRHMADAEIDAVVAYLVSMP